MPGGLKFSRISGALRDTLFSRQSTISMHTFRPSEAIIYETMEKIPGTRVRIIVDGEEDLLVLPVCTRAKDGFTVLYGQPNEGIIVVRADLTSRNKAKSLLDSIK